MTRQVLIDNIVRQTTILIAQLATSGGVRSPLARVADQVFLDLARELDAQGISRKVSADMFGMALRSYRRRVRQLSESSTERGRSLWEAVLGFLSGGRLVTRVEVFERFARDEEELVKGVLTDLCETGLVFRIGAGRGAAYRAATTEELADLGSRSDGLRELLWMLIYREGPLADAELCKRTGIEATAIEAKLEELVEAGRITRTESGLNQAESLVLPLGSPSGAEAALFDHYQAVVKTMCARMRRTGNTKQAGEAGGSTYSFTIWADHPHEDEVLGLLRNFRQHCSELRERIERYNENAAPPTEQMRVTVYGGLCAVGDETDDSERGDDESVG